MDEIIMLTEQGKEKVKTICSCECEEIVESVIAPLSNHCLTVENKTRSFYYLLECASAYVHLSNNYMVSGMYYLFSLQPNTFPHSLPFPLLKPPQSQGSSHFLHVSVLQ